ncbi:MAG: two-component regulator propeller domain-containing protein [Bacteroidota bacterium]|nr:two-component regulator propeller domain-containing protein [Bacteroidota bacterium]
MRLLLYSISFIISLPIFSQIGTRQWQDHVGFSYCNSITRFGNDIIASNGNGLVRVDQTEYSTQSLNKINGLHDIGVRIVRVNPYNNKLLVIYDNCNIDVIDANYSISNYSDFKTKLLSGKKIINDVTFSGKFAYLACGFGIVLFDTEKLEIKETFYIGMGGENLEVFQIALTDSLIYAGTPKGILKSNYKTKILNNFKNWSTDSLPNLPKESPIGCVSNVGGKIVAAYTPWKLDASINLQDTIYTLNANSWAKYVNKAYPATIKKFCQVDNNSLAYIDQFGMQVLDFSNNIIQVYLTTFNNQPTQPNDGFFGKDNNTNMSYWVADGLNGIVQSFGSNPYYAQQSINVNGTKTFALSKIDVFGGKVAVAHSYPDNGGGSNYMRNGISILNENVWNEFKFDDFSANPIFDINNVYIDRKDKTRYFASSWYTGLLEYKDNKLVNVYNHANSGMPEIYPGAPRCSGLGMDNNGNLWFTNSNVAEFLSVFKKDGSFQRFNFPFSKFVRRILVDKNNFVWMPHEFDGGISVFNANGFGVPQNNVNYRILTKELGSGNLESNVVFAVAEDKDGKIWVGTEAGIRVFYNPSNIFSSSNFDAQPIKIIQDGNVELLLEKETITAIAVDGANNKWVGTLNSGAYCFSPDGQKQLYHFTKEDSPLYSNNIIDLNYDFVSGDVFFGTDVGIQSFRSTIIEGDESYQNVYAYPNPVKPNYQGTVLVRGLIDNSIVKIVDESGNLAWETKSTGGQIEWDLKTLSGNRVQTGVYVVYASTTNGEQRAVTKVLVVN